MIHLISLQPLTPGSDSEILKFDSAPKADDSDFPSSKDPRLAFLVAYPDMTAFQEVKWCL